MMHTFKTRFNNLSLYKKILFIVSVTLFFAYLVFFLSIHFLTNTYEEELYQADAQALNHVSSSISAEMLAIETISDQIIADSDIQDYLFQLAERSGGSRSALYKRDIYQALYPYTYQNPYIKSINILLEDESNICMGNNTDLGQFDTDLLKRSAQMEEGRSQWQSALKPGNDVVCFRQIKQLKFLRLRKLADLYIVIDMELLIRHSLTYAGYVWEDSNFILMDGEKRIYPEKEDLEDSYGIFLDAMRQSGNRYMIATIQKEKCFMITGLVPGTDWSYLYVRDYDPIFHRVLDAKFRVTVCTLCFAVMALAVTQLIFKGILKHLDFLVEKIHRFGNGEPAPWDKRAYDYEGRQDEIGQLHHSFENMTKSVKVLRDENYDKQILLRDATIQMFQQQINPHFLYNTLDTINWMAQAYGADDISVMVRSLGNLFRASITTQEGVIPLTDELSVLENYIKIQRIRFKDRLDFRLNLPDSVSHIEVPKLCIQPLVENALKHALEDIDEMCTIGVTVEEDLEDYTIQVANTGSFFEENLLTKIKDKKITPQGSGVGLVNIDSRMRLLYGEGYGLEFSNKNNMAVVMLRIPKKGEKTYVKNHDCG